MSFHIAIVDKVMGTVRETAGPFTTYQDAQQHRANTRRLYRQILPSRGSLGKSLDDELDMKIIVNADHGKAA